MDWWLRTIILAAGGVGLLWVNLWYGIRVCRHVFPAPPDTIAPFRLMGKDVTTELAATRGPALAHLLRGRLRHLQNDVTESQKVFQKLQSIKPRTNHITIPEASDASGRLEVPLRVFQKSDVQLTVSGVEVSGLLPWLKQMIEAPNLLEVTVQYGDAKAFIAANSHSEIGPNLWLESESTDDKIIDQLAYALWKRQLELELPEIAALSAEEFIQFVNTLKATADLERQRLSGKEDPAAWNPILSQLQPLLEKVPTWTDMLQFAQSIAERAGDADSQLKFAAMEHEILLSLLEDLDAENDADLIQEYQDRRLKIENWMADALTQQKPRAVAQMENNQRFPSVEVRDLLTQQLSLPASWLQETAEATNQDEPVPIATIGVPIPEGIIPATSLELIDPEQSNSPEHYSWHTASTVSCLHFMAPASKIRIHCLASMDQGVLSLLSKIASQITNDGEASVLHFAFVANTPGLGTLFNRLRDANTMCVIAAGNESTDKVAGDVDDGHLIVAAIDRDGQAADFSKFALGDERVVWVPGTQIPARQADGYTTWTGTSASSALAAALAARLRSQFPKIPPKKLVNILRETSKPLVADGPPVINVKAAMEKLKSL